MQGKSSSFEVQTAGLGVSKTDACHLVIFAMADSLKPEDMGWLWQLGRLPLLVGSSDGHSIGLINAYCIFLIQCYFRDRDDFITISEYRIHI